MDAHLHGTYTIVEKAKEYALMDLNYVLDVRLSEISLIKTKYWKNAEQDFLTYLNSRKIVYNIAYPYVWGKQCEYSWQEKVQNSLRLINFRGIHPIYICRNEFVNCWINNVCSANEHEFISRDPNKVLSLIINELQNEIEQKKNKLLKCLRLGLNNQSNHRLHNLLQYFELPKVELSYADNLKSNNKEESMTFKTTESCVWEYNLGEVGLDPSYLEVDYEQQVSLLELQLEKMWLDIYDFIKDRMIDNRIKYIHYGNIRLNIHSQKNSIDILRILEKNLSHLIKHLLNIDKIDKSIVEYTYEINIEIMWYFHAFNEPSQNFEKLIIKFRNILKWLSNYYHSNCLNHNINVLLAIGKNAKHNSERNKGNKEQLKKLIEKAQKDLVLQHQLIEYEETDSPYLYKIL